MDRVRNYYLQHSADVGLKEAFAWDESSTPPLGKVSSIAFLLALSVIAIDTVLALVAFVYADLVYKQNMSNRNILILFGLFYAGLQVIMYFVALRDRPRI